MYIYNVKQSISEKLNKITLSSDDCTKHGNNSNGINIL